MKTYICIIMAILMMNVPYLAFAQESSAAGMIPTANVVEEMSRAQTQEHIQKILNKPELKSKLAKLGLSQDEIGKRLATLSDSELRQMASQIDQARYGGDELVGILVIVILVLLVIYLAKRV